jgi:hypothetical protein
LKRVRIFNLQTQVNQRLILIRKVTTIAASQLNIGSKENEWFKRSFTSAICKLMGNKWEKSLIDSYFAHKTTSKYPLNYVLILGGWDVISEAWIQTAPLKSF